MLCWIAAQAEELFLWVPRKMLMTVQSAQSSILGEDSLRHNTVAASKEEVWRRLQANRKQHNHTKETHCIKKGIESLTIAQL